MNLTYLWTYVFVDIFTEVYKMIKKTTCKNCGKKFETEFTLTGNKPKIVFCSQECCDEYNEKDEFKRFATCKNCGKKYQTKMYMSGKYNRSEYCSTECYNEYFEREKRYIPPEGKCLWCGGVVKPRKKQMVNIGCLLIVVMNILNLLLKQNFHIKKKQNAYVLFVEKSLYIKQIQKQENQYLLNTVVMSVIELVLNKIEIKLLWKSMVLVTH